MYVAQRLATANHYVDKTRIEISPMSSINVECVEHPTVDLNNSSLYHSSIIIIIEDLNTVALFAPLSSLLFPVSSAY